ncbi:MAG: hypothetical protein V3U96_00380 [Paracoccaceae bacterium]
MTYSIRDVANAVAKTTNREDKEGELFNRLKSMAQYRTLKTSKAPGAGKTAARRFDREEACIAALFCILADYNFDQRAFDSLRHGIQPSASGNLQGKVDGNTVTTPYWGDDPYADGATNMPDNHIAMVIPEIERGKGWHLRINLKRDARGDPLFSGGLYQSDDIPTPEELKELWGAHDDYQENVVVGSLLINATEILKPVLELLGPGQSTKGKQ